MAAYTDLPVYLVLFPRPYLVTTGMFWDSCSGVGIVGTDLCEPPTTGVTVPEFMKTRSLKRHNCKRMTEVNQLNELSIPVPPFALFLHSMKCSLSWLLQLFSLSKESYLTSGRKNSTSSIVALGHTPAQPPGPLFIQDQHSHFSQRKLYLCISE